MDPLWSETCWSTFKYFTILIVSTYYILCISWIKKVFNYHWCTVRTWRFRADIPSINPTLSIIQEIFWHIAHDKHKGRQRFLVRDSNYVHSEQTHLLCGLYARTFWWMWVVSAFKTKDTVMYKTGREIFNVTQFCKHTKRKESLRYRTVVHPYVEHNTPFSLPKLEVLN